MKKLTYECIIIGGGPAGSTLATTLSDLGRDVLVLEREKFPREHVGESLLPFCYYIFQDLGILDKIEAKFTRKPGVKFSNIDSSRFSKWCFKHVIEDNSYLSFHVHRAQFDDILLQNSREHGAEVQEEMKVLGVDFDKLEEHSIVRTADKDGNEHELTARFVIDCTGQDTLLARQLKLKEPYETLNKRVALSTHWVNCSPNMSLEEGNIEIVHLEGEKLGWIWIIPIWKDRFSVGVALNMDYSIAQRKLLSKEHKDWQKALYLQEIATSPEVSAVLKNAEMAQPLVANGDFSYYATTKYNDKFALVGDSAGFIDPIFSSGIYLAMKSAQLVGNSINEYLSTGSKDSFEQSYKEIAGAYALIEKLVTTFYDPDSISFTGAEQTIGNHSFKKFETAYSLIHLILAGDFFTNHEKYIQAIEVLRNPAMIEKYRNLIGHPAVHQVNKVCSKTPKESLV